MSALKKGTQGGESEDRDEGKTSNPVKQTRFVTEQDSSQHTQASLVEAMEGSFPSIPPPECVPPHKVRVARFPKDEKVPCPAERYTVDVTAEQDYQMDAGLNHIPDFREDWGDEEKWTLHRRAYRTFVTSGDIEEPDLQGYYVIFTTFSPDYEKNKHQIFEGRGRHVHDDFFVVKIGRRVGTQRWTRYIDMPDQFFSATTKDGKKVYEVCLFEKANDMVGMLYA